MTGTALIIENVLSQYVEGATFLWKLRSAAVASPHYLLADLARLDGRLEAHLDGLRTMGLCAWQACEQAFSDSGDCAIFALAMLAFESGCAGRVQAVTRMAVESPGSSGAFASALGWLGVESGRRHIDSLLASASPILRRAGIAACAITRVDPGPPLRAAIADADPRPRSRALRAVGELGLIDCLAAVNDCLTDDEPECRFWSAWSSSILSNSPRSLALLREFVESGSYCGAALNLLPRRMSLADANRWRGVLGANPKTQRAAVVAAGLIGDPESIPWLIEQMTAPKPARVAGEAFTMITGLDLAYHDLDVRPPEGFEAGPTENPEDEDVAMDPDEHLPWPDASAIPDWWTRHRDALSPGVRYLAGNPVSIASCSQILRSGRQRQRAAAALELAVRQSGTQLFNVAAPGFRQRELLGTGPYRGWK